MSLKSLLFNVGKSLDNPRNNTPVTETKFQAIEHSDRYFHLMDSVSNEEIDFLVSQVDYDDPLKNYDFHANFRNKWLVCSEEMKLIDPPTYLPTSANKLFIDAHNLLVQSAILRSRICELEMSIIKATLAGDFDSALDFKKSLQDSKKLDEEIHTSFRNAFDTVLHLIN